MRPGDQDYDVIVDMGHLPQVMLDDYKNPKLVRAAQITVIDFVQPLVDRVLYGWTPAGTGLARTLLQYERPDKHAVEMTGRVGFAQPASDYLLFVEQGTKAHWAPEEPLFQWAARKFPGPRAVEIGWLVHFSIRRKGTKAQWFIRNAQEELIPPVTQMMIDKLEQFFAAPWNIIRNMTGI